MDAGIPTDGRFRSRLTHDMFLAVAIGTAMLAFSLITLSLLTDLNDERQVITERSIDVETPDGTRMATVSQSSLFGRRFYLGSLGRWPRARFHEAGIEVGAIGLDNVPKWVLRGPFQWIEQGGPAPSRAKTIIVIGWPIPCLWCEMTHRYPNGGLIPESYPIGGIKLADRAADASGRPPMPIVIPLRPLLIPLGINLSFYVVLAFLSQVGFRWTRRAIRSRRGLCPCCAYDLHATPSGSPCPECGAALQSGARN